MLLFKVIPIIIAHWKDVNLHILVFFIAINSVSIQTAACITVSGYTAIDSSDFGKKYVNQIIGFKDLVAIGSEQEHLVNNVIRIGEPTYIVGYFEKNMASTGGIPSMRLRLKKAGAKESDRNEWLYDCIQPSYIRAPSRDLLQDSLFLRFAFFPDPDSLHFESHLEFVPYYNVALWLSTLPVGVYELTFTMGLRTEMAQGQFIVQVNPGDNAKAKGYLDKLFSRKLNSTKFPLPSCQNKAGAIPNVQELSRFGKLIKVDYVATGEEIEVQLSKKEKIKYILAKGVGIFEVDGKYELVNLEFRKEKGTSYYEYTGPGPKPMDLILKCNDEDVIFPRIHRNGYEIPKENIYYCQYW